VAVALSVLALGLLAHVASTSAEHQFTRHEETRTQALVAADQLLERLRSDPDWAGLRARLHGQQQSASLAGGTEARLSDGRKAFAPETYYPSFATPEGIESLGVLIELPPEAPLDVDPEGVPVFREDVVAPLFGLPADLNGDGAIDGGAREGDYTSLPVCIRVRWGTPDGGSAELRLPAWLGGTR
jgi:hypothetical protein